MAWQEEVTETARVVLGDLEVPYTYPDDRIERISIVAATQVLNETDFDNNYIVDVSLSSIVPDPTQQTVKDNIFVCLVALKTACLIINASVKQYAGIGGINVHDGPSSVDTKGLFANFIALDKQYKDDYEFLKMNYKIMRSNANSQAILTCTTNRNIYGSMQALSF